MKRHAVPVLLGLACVALWAVPSLVEIPENPLLVALWGGGLFLRRHLFTALVPAFLLAGATTTFLDRRAVITYLGSNTCAPLAYGLSAIASSIMAFCSCMVLPVFAGIYRRGAGLGPAVTFLYCGPAINVMALLLTASVLGASLGLARAAAAVTLGIVAGASMQVVFGNRKSTETDAAAPDAVENETPVWRGVVVLCLLVAAAGTANWARTGELQATAICCPDGEHYYEVEGDIIRRTSHNLVLRDEEGRTQRIPRPNVVAVESTWLGPGSGSYGFLPWAALGAAVCGLALSITRWYDLSTLRNWGAETLGFVDRLLPLLLAGIVGSVLLFGYRGQDGLIAHSWIRAAVGGNSPRALLTASVAGSGMYFATLTEIPIVQGLVSSGMGHGSALTMLLAGPVVSLPALLVVRNVLGNSRTAIYVLLVVLTAVCAGAAYALVL